jgi:hypothetical protein
MSRRGSAIGVVELLKARLLTPGEKVRFRKRDGVVGETTHSGAIRTADASTRGHSEASE